MSTRLGDQTDRDPDGELRRLRAFFAAVEELAAARYGGELNKVFTSCAAECGLLAGSEPTYSRSRSALTPHGESALTRGRMILREGV